MIRARIAVLCAVSVAFLLVSLSALGKGQLTRVGEINVTYNPTSPPAELSSFQVLATFKGSGHGQPCTIRNLTASIGGNTRSASPTSATVHVPDSTPRFRFDFPGFPAGTDVTPTFSYTATSRNGSDCSCVERNSCIVLPGGPPIIPDTAKPNLTITKEVVSPLAGEVVPGQTVQYRLQIENIGNATASNVTVSDNLDSRLLFEGSDKQTSTAPAVGSSGAVEWSINSLAANADYSITVTVSVDTGAVAGQVDNIATTSVSIGGSNVVTQSNVVSVNVNREPKVVLGKTINDKVSTRKTVLTGSAVTYNIRYDNVGFASAGSVVITDRLPDELIGTPSFSPAASWDPLQRLVTWTLVDVAPDDPPGYVAVSAQIDPGTTSPGFGNTANTSWSSASGSGSSSSNDTYVDLQKEPFFKLSKRILGQTTVAPGDVVQYQIDFENIGATTAAQTTIVDSVPTGLTPVPNSFTGSFDASKMTITWTLGDVDPGQPGSFTYNVTVDTGTLPGDLANIAVIDADNLPAPFVASAQAKINVLGLVDLEISKTLDKSSQNYVVDGDRVTYRIQVRNRGNVTATKVEVLDDLPPGLLYESSSPKGAGAGSSWAVDLPDIDAGGSSAIVSVTARVDGSQLQDGEIVANVARTQATDQQNNNYSATSPTVRVTYNAPPTISIEKSALPPQSVPVFQNDVIDYTITATLETIVGVSDLQVIDFLPPELEFVSSSIQPESVNAAPNGGTLIVWPKEALLVGQAQYSFQAKVKATTPPGTSVFNIGGALYDVDRLDLDFTNHYTSDAAVALTKSLRPDQQQIVPGETLVYNIVIENTGKIDLTDLRLIDTLPEDTTYNTASKPNAASINGKVLEWNFPVLNPGKSINVQLLVDTSSVLVGTTLLNTVQILTNEGQPRTASASTVVRAAPALRVTKTVDNAVAHPGEEVNYTIEYSNIGDGNALDVELRDNFPSELEFVSASGGAIGPDAKGNIVWKLGNLNAKTGPFVQVVKARVRPGSYLPAVKVPNLVSLESQKDSTTDSAQVTIVDLPDFSISKQVAGGTTSVFGHAAPGDVLHYTLDLTKTGSAATDVLVADLLPNQVTYVDGSSTPPIDTTLSDISAGLLVWDVGSLSEGNKQGVFTFNAKLDAVIDNGTKLYNRAGMQSAERGAIYSAPVLTIIDSAPVLDVRKTASTATLYSPAPGQGENAGNITYTIEIENLGDSVASNVVITDTLPDELVIDAGSTSGSVTGSGQTVEWSVGNLDPKVPVTVIVSAKVKEGLPGNTVLRNVAQATTDTPGVGNAVSNEVVVTVSGEAIFELKKTASDDIVLPNQQFVYTLSYTNVGTDSSGPITIEDSLPGGVIFVDASDGGASQAPAAPLLKPGLLQWVNLPSLAQGATNTLQVTVRVNDVIPDGTKLPNTAVLYETLTPSKSVQSQFVGAVPIVSSAPFLTINKTSDTGAYVAAGGKVSFDIAYENSGGDSANNPVIVDVLPPGLSLVSASGNPKISGDGSIITWSASSLAAKDSGNLKVVARADVSLQNGKDLTNSASISSTETPRPVIDSETVSIQNAVLSINKTVNSKTVNSGNSGSGQPGDLLVYSIDYENTGAITASDVVVEDILPGDVIFEFATPQPDSVKDQTLSWNIGSLKSSESGSILIQARVGNDLRDGTELVNYASVDSNNTGKIFAQPAKTMVVSSALLTIDKTSAVNQVLPGQTFSYEITVKNAGSDVAENVVITDVLPPDVVFVDASANGQLVGDAVIWDIEKDFGPMGPDTDLSLQVKVRANDVIADGTPLLNRSVVSGKKPDGTILPEATATLLVPVISNPDLLLIYSVDKQLAQPGDALLYTLQVRNAGNDIALNPAVYATLPPNSSPQTISNNGRFEQGQAVWTASALPPTGFINLQFSVSVDATVADGAIEPSLAVFTADNAAAQTDQVETIITAQPALLVSKVGPNSVAVPNAITYQIDYSNLGNGVAVNGVLEDLIPVGTAFAGASDGGTETFDGSGVVRWDLGDVAAGSGGRVSVSIDTPTSALDGTKLTNLVSFDSANGSRVTDTAVTYERSHTELEVTITANFDPVAPGDKQVFTVTWANTGNQNTTGAQVTATVPADTLFDSATGSSTAQNNTVVWAVGSLPAGAAGQEQFTVDVSASGSGVARSGTLLKSVADITADEGLPDSDEALFAVTGDDNWPNPSIPESIPTSHSKLWLIILSLLIIQLAWFQWRFRRPC